MLDKAAVLLSHASSFPAQIMDFNQVEDLARNIYWLFEPNARQLHRLTRFCMQQELERHTYVVILIFLPLLVSVLRLLPFSLTNSLFLLFASFFSCSSTDLFLAFSNYRVCLFSSVMH